MRRRRNNLQKCPLQDSNTGDSDLWSNTLPLDHGGAPFGRKCNFKSITMYPLRSCLIPIKQTVKSALEYSHSLVNLCSNKILLFTINEEYCFTFVTPEKDEILTIRFLVNPFKIIIWNILHVQTVYNIMFIQNSLMSACDMHSQNNQSWLECIFCQSYRHALTSKPQH